MRVDRLGRRAHAVAMDRRRAVGVLLQAAVKRLGQVHGGSSLRRYLAASDARVCGYAPRFSAYRTAHRARDGDLAAAPLPKWLRHGHGWIPITASLVTTAPLLTIVTEQCDVNGRPPERCDMSPRLRIASMSLASVTVIGLTSRSASHHRPPPNHARARPPLHNPRCQRRRDPDSVRALAVQPPDRAQARRRE